MKKLISVFVIGVLCLGILAGCGKKELTPEEKLAQEFEQNMREELGDEGYEEAIRQMEEAIANAGG